MQARRIVIVGRKNDPSVQLLLGAWRGQGALLLSPGELTSRGFSHDPGRPEADRITLQGQTLEAASLLAVVPRLEAVTPGDLPHLRAIDRAYAAAESTAVLVSWLSSLACPVVNRPQASAPIGSGWSHGRWLREALQHGQAVEPARLEVKRGAPDVTRGAGASVLVVGRETFAEDAHPSLEHRALALARASGTELLEVRFSSGEEGAGFAWANVLPQLTPGVADALFRHILECSSSPPIEGGSP